MEEVNLWDTLLPSIIKEWNLDKDNFLRHPTIAKTLHPVYKSPEFKSRYINKYSSSKYIQDDPLYGNPYLIDDKHSLITLQSTMYFETISTFKLLEGIDTIYDVGAGYGNMAWLIRKNGFLGRYISIDFPEMQLIQKDWLSKAGIMDIEFNSINNIKPTNSLLIGTHSINEMPLKTRSMIPFTEFSSIFIAHNRVFNNIDNLNYFDQLGKSLNNHTTYYLNSPMQSEHWFFMAKANE